MSTLPKITLADCGLYKTFDETFRAKLCEGYFMNPDDGVRVYVYREDQRREAEASYERDFGNRHGKMVFVAL